MILIGLTGSVGTGKSEVGKMFIEKKIPVFDSDKQVSSILKKRQVLEKLKKNFPTAFEKQSLIRKNLAHIVFNDEQKLKILENIIYEKLKEVQFKWIRLLIGKRTKLAVWDVPLLFEKDNVQKYDFILVTTCAYTVQKYRVLKRKDWNYKRFELTLRKQVSDKYKRKNADMIFFSDRGKRYSYNKVTYMLKKLIINKKRTADKILINFK